jgi:hypothetical protein
MRRLHGPAINIIFGEQPSVAIRAVSEPGESRPIPESAIL